MSRKRVCWYIMVAKEQSQVHQNINRRDGKSTKKEVASWIMIVGVKSMMYVCRMQLKVMLQQIHTWMR